MSEEKRYGCGRFKKKPRKWTEEEDQFVRDNIADMTHAEIADELDRTEGSVNGYCTRNQIKTPGNGQFQKGQEPWNKGKRPEEYMDDEALANMKKTQFKPGHTPANTKYDGALSIRKDTDTGIYYVYIRISKRNWRLYHRVIWEREHGPIPEDNIIVFKDGNSLNVKPENLEMIDRAEHARRNQNWRKAMQTMEEQGNHPSKHLTDNYVAGMLAGGDKELKEYLLQKRPDLIRVARANYKLKRTITNEETED